MPEVSEAPGAHEMTLATTRTDAYVRCLALGRPFGSAGLPCVTCLPCVPRCISLYRLSVEMLER